MRSLLSKTTAALVALFMVFGLLALPAASAQPYPPYPPPTPEAAFTPANNCETSEPPELSIVDTDLMVQGIGGFLSCDLNWEVGINPVLYNGPPPVNGLLTLPIPALEGDDHTATITVTTAVGVQKSSSLKISPATLAAARAKAAAAGDAATGSVPAAPVVVQAPDNLAFTGSTVNLPLAVGAFLVGAGGLTLLAARKREQDA